MHESPGAWIYVGVVSSFSFSWSASSPLDLSEEDSSWLTATHQILCTRSCSTYILADQRFHSHHTRVDRNKSGPRPTKSITSVQHGLSRFLSLAFLSNHLINYQTWHASLLPCSIYGVAFFSQGMLLRWIIRRTWHLFAFSTPPAMIALVCMTGTSHSRRKSSSPIHIRYVRTTCTIHGLGRGGNCLQTSCSLD